jgi:hypothetical protein
VLLGSVRHCSRTCRGKAKSYDAYQCSDYIFTERPSHMIHTSTAIASSPIDRVQCKDNETRNCTIQPDRTNIDDTGFGAKLQVHKGGGSGQG